MPQPNPTRWSQGFGTKLAIGGLFVALVGLIGFNPSSVVRTQALFVGLGFLVAGLGQGFRMIEQRLSRLEADRAAPSGVEGPWRSPGPAEDLARHGG